MSLLKARVGVVTGAAGGIGRATCLALARQGARIVAVDRDAERLKALVNELHLAAGASSPRRDGSDVALLSLDITSEEDAEAMAAAVLRQYGRIDILVNAAGILRAHGRPPAKVVDLSLSDWDAVMRTNLRGVFLTCRAVLPTMIQQGQGDIINISSTSGQRGVAFDAPYSASKFGVLALSESLADEVRQHGVRVQTIVPGPVDTPLWDQNAPLPRPPAMLQTDRVADLIVFLVTLPADARLVNPTILPQAHRHRARPG
jgi:3-oxoacyl-[acyl-carrier protein] reductase